ncbi:MAG: M2 family metallopeptidase [Acidobacteriota bacterium]
MGDAMKALMMVTIALAASTPSSAAQEANDMPRRFRTFLREFEQRIAPLERQANLAYWEAATTGSGEAYRRQADAQLKLETAFSDRGTFAFLKSIRESGAIVEPLEKRQLERLFLAFLGRQIDPAMLAELTARASRIEQRFSTFRARVDGVEVTDNRIEDVLASSRDRSQRKAHWLASRQVGAELAQEVREIAALRNRAAVALGFRDHYALQLALAEQDERWLFGLFDELDRLTRRPYADARERIDAVMAARAGIEADALMPWDYGDRFFQEAPNLSEADVDAPLTGRDLAALASSFFAGIGLDVAPILSRSDLHERPGKNPHAFSTDIDRQGDVRILLNLQPNQRWFDTILHELGHGSYSYHTRRDLPNFLRTDAHLFATEGVAMLLGRLASNAAFYRGAGLVDDVGAARLAGPMHERTRLQALVFSRWCQVMLRFERELYADPRQDLDAVWWSLVEGYQGLRRPAEAPAGAWASKIHLVTAPVYYHNYELGELFASQLHAAIVRELFPGVPSDSVVYVGDRRVGSFLKERVFAPGASLPWREFVVRATGEELGPRAFATQFLVPAKPTLREPVGTPVRVSE